MTLPYTAVLCDLDGTILDSAPGITATLAYTFERIGVPVPSPSGLLEYVGPPILDAFRDLAGLTPEQSAEALEIYRARYLDQGTTDSRVYSGMPEVLRAIRDSPMRMSLATSKPELPATLMLEHFVLAGCFDVITGASADETRSAKADVVAEALRRLRDLGADLERVVMIGDRIHDVEGAAAHGVPTIFVEWGYGSPAESAGASLIVSSAEELREALGL
ncbi:phosphoglycolate phosphatase [Diaminobutyricimonas aerilata]|uniref:Phosphoglycolate phosphatase n=1 Tax=Diaminobutyricimonas aerilata TaxID=1162967 RepID=A0A2M9CF68_9MICO|nr:HAD hydrolase-like protein [Diaminobutyricimonas aerilata]PJJ70528.1 phosphoglycolate phosphatase [Diaminobutyricimonas aerilata]